MKPTAQQPRFYKFRKYQVPQYIKDALDALKPPDDITVSQWAEQYRQLSRKESNLQGAWRNSVTPYLVGIMDEFNNWETERIVVVKPTQVGGTEVELNALGYLIDQDPAPTLIVYPNDEIAESTSANRIMSITEIATAILPNVMEIIGTIAMFMAAKIGIPWLREQRIFSLVRKLVKGAEKAAEAGKIPKTDKHALVVKLLKMKGIEVTPFLDAFIDAAIKEMDEVAENIADEITKE